MGELKPLGSEKLEANAKLKRILELTYYQQPTDSKKSSEVIRETKTGVYGIVKEKDGFYVKKGLNESSLDYIGGLYMKNKNRFSSYGEAFKKLEFLCEQENVQEATRYVLKRDKPASPPPRVEAPIPEPTGEMPPAPASPEGAMPPAPPDAGEEMPGGSEDEMSPEEQDEDDYLKVIQKLSGKLQQKLMAYKDKLESKDIKSAIMQVLSGVDLVKQLDDSDREEILDEFEPDEETSDEEMPGEEIPNEPTAETPPTEDELGETDGMAALEELITHPFEDDYEGGYDDDEDVPEPLDFEDPAAEKFAQSSYGKEYDDEEEDEYEDEPEGLTSKTQGPEEEETDEQMTDTSSTEPYTPEDTGAVKELDLDELANSVKETLSKYFES